MVHCEMSAGQARASNNAFVSSFQGPILRERPLPLKAPQGFPPRPPPPFSLRPKEPRLEDTETAAVGDRRISSGEPESAVDLAKAKEEMYMLPSSIRQSAAATERPSNYKLRLQVRKSDELQGDTSR